MMCYLVEAISQIPTDDVNQCKKVLDIFNRCVRNHGLYQYVYELNCNLPQRL